MKKIILILLLCLTAYADIKVDTLEVKSVDYENGMIGPTKFKILCINGYQWLQSGISSSATLSQMLVVNAMNNARPIPCENKKEQK